VKKIIITTPVYSGVPAYWGRKKVANWQRDESAHHNRASPPKEQ